MNKDFTPELIAYLEEEGYSNIRAVPGQGICAIMGMMFTIAVVCGCTADGYEFRYCFPREFPGEAEKALEEWDGIGHLGGRWIKCKGKGGDILNPNYETFFKK